VTVISVISENGLARHLLKDMTYKTRQKREKTTK